MECGENLYCQKVLPAVFDDSLSYYEAICKLVYKVNEIVNADNELREIVGAISLRVDSNEESIRRLRADIMALDLKVENYNSELHALIAQIFEMLKLIGESQIAWNVTKGTYTDTMTANRDLFNYVTVHGIRSDDLPKYVNTVTQLADCGLNVHGLAVLGLYLVAEFEIPPYFLPVEKQSKRRLTPIDLSKANVTDDYFVKVD